MKDNKKTCFIQRVHCLYKFIYLKYLRTNDEISHRNNKKTVKPSEAGIIC